MTPPRSELPPIRLSYPADALAAIPYLLGFHPAASVVVLAIRGQTTVLTARHDLPLDQTAPAPAPTLTRAEPGPTVADMVAHLVTTVCQQAATAAIVVGYGAAGPVRAAVMPLASA